MEESVWKQCTPILLNALERRGQSNTDVRIAWGREAMYLFFTCADPDVWGTLSEHDGKLWEEEVVEAFIDADNDGLDYVEIEVSPRNVTFDAWITRFPPTREEIPIFARYEAVGMRTAVVVHGTLEDRSDRDEGWDCEIAIPWSAFEETGGRPPKAGSAWSGNFFRCDLSHGQGEYQAWIPVRGSFHQPDRFGNIVFSGGN
ncbi:carbohydrate-binding family 9-like protein [bacterium]|nr:carbohydrate-binding family 9-like protein [bacterium]